MGRPALPSPHQQTTTANIALSARHQTRTTMEGSHEDRWQTGDRCDVDGVGPAKHPANGAVAVAIGKGSEGRRKFWFPDVARPDETVSFDHVSEDDFGASPDAAPVPSLSSPTILSSLPLDADQYTYEAVCATGVCEVVVHSTCEACDNDVTLRPAITAVQALESAAASTGEGAGDLDARLDVLEEVQLCGIVPVLPRSAPFSDLVQQMVPCTLYMPTKPEPSPSSSPSLAPTEYPSVLDVLRTAQREHYYAMLRDRTRHAPATARFVVGVPTSEKEAAHDAGHRGVGGTQGEHHGGHDSAVPLDCRGAPGSPSPPPVDGPLTEAHLRWVARDVEAHQAADEAAHQRMWHAAREGCGALVEWTTGMVGYTADTVGLSAEQQVRLERTFFLPATPYWASGPTTSLTIASAPMAGLTEVTAESSAEASSVAHQTPVLPASVLPRSNQAQPAATLTGPPTGSIPPSATGAAAGAGGCTLSPSTLRGVALTQLARLRHAKRERSHYLHCHCQHRLQVARLESPSDAQATETVTSCCSGRDTGGGSDCCDGAYGTHSTSSSCAMCRVCHKYDAVFVQLTMSTAAIYPYLVQLHIASTIPTSGGGRHGSNPHSSGGARSPTSPVAPTAGGDDDPSLQFQSLRTASSSFGFAALATDAESPHAIPPPPPPGGGALRDWSWFDDRILDEVLLVAVTPRGSPYGQRLLPLSEAYVFLLSRKLEEMIAVQTEVVLPVAMGREERRDEDHRPSDHSSQQRPHHQKCLLDAYRSCFVRELQSTHPDVWPACEQLHVGYPVKVEGDTDNDGAPPLISTKYEEDIAAVHAMGALATLHIAHAVRDVQDHLLRLILAALQPVLYRRTFVTYEVMRLLSSKSLFVANRALIAKYQAWLLETPSPGAVLRLMNRSRRLGAALRRAFPWCYTVGVDATTGGSCNSGTPSSPGLAEGKAEDRADEEVGSSSTGSSRNYFPRRRRRSAAAGDATCLVPTPPPGIGRTSRCGNVSSPYQFVPECALLQPEYLPRFAAWAGGRATNSCHVAETPQSPSPHQGGHGHLNLYTANPALNMLLKYMTCKGRTMTLHEIDLFIATVVRNG